MVLSAGKSGAVTYTNLDTDPEESLTFPSRGTALRVTTQSDGTQLLEFSGNVGIILFPTDVPAGPSTTQINGRLVLSFDPASGFTEVLKQEGKQIDVCAPTFLTGGDGELDLSVALDAANRDQESRSRWRLNLAQPNAAPD